MIDWNDVHTQKAPKDRVILVSNGWSWRREDIKLRRGTVPHKSICGGAVLVHWVDDALSNSKGAYVLCGGGGLAPSFRFWADINNPITQDTVTENEMVTNQIPNAEDMPHYQPSEQEIHNREFRKMVGL